MMSLFDTKYRDHHVALSLWFIVFIVYLQTIATAVGFIDSGELATVPFVLGIAHPTGYPLWSLIARLFTSLPIAAEEIVRLNIFCALATSLAVVCFYYVMLFALRVGEARREASEIRIPAVFASLALAFSQTFWEQSTSVEVYGLHLLLLAATLLFFLRAVFAFMTSSVIDTRRWWLFAFVLGLSFTNHMTTILLAPAFLFLYFSAFRLTKEGVRLIASMVIPFLLGLTVYLYFPVRGSEHPILNWGHPSTLERILWHVSGKQYRVWMFASTSVAAKQWNHFLNAVPTEFYFLPLLLSLLGAWRLLLRNRRLFLFIFLLLAGCVAYSINYDIHDIDSYFLLAYLSLAMFAGFGALEAGAMIKSSKGRAGLTVVLGSFVIAEAVANWPEVDASGNFLVEDYSTNILSTLKPHAVILSYQWDYFVSASYYLQYVKHVREDVTVVDKELLRRSWYFLQMKQNHPGLYAKSRGEIESFLAELDKFEHDVPYDPPVIEARYNRMIDSFIDHNIDSVAVYVTPEIESHLASHYLRVPEGLAFRLYRDSLYHPFDFPEISYRPYHKKDSYTLQLNGMYTVMLTQRALYEQSFGKMELPLRYLQRAYEINPNAGTLQLLERFGTPAPQH